MYTVNSGNKTVFLRDISREQLVSVLKWYNDIENYMYATGMDKPITVQEFYGQYKLSTDCADEFFAGIFPAFWTELMIGAVKGKICPEGTAWINSIVIDRGFQNMGYGKAAIELLSSSLHVASGIKSLYISVVEKNQKGRSFWSRLGFQEIRKLEKHLQLKGRYHNVLIMNKELV